MNLRSDAPFELIAAQCNQIRTLIFFIVGNALPQSALDTDPTADFFDEDDVLMTQLLARVKEAESKVVPR